ncbi:hypothetical protein V8F20_010956 [Naviculisporaceae sp. PSN 640]
MSPPMNSIFGGEADEARSPQQPANFQPLLANPNRLVGPIVGLDYLTREIPNEILLMIVNCLLKSDKPRNFRANQSILYRLSLVNRHMNALFERQLYLYNARACRSFGRWSNAKMLAQQAVTFSIVWATLHNLPGTIAKAVKYNQGRDVVNLVTYLPDFRRHIPCSLIPADINLATALQFAAMSHATSPATVQTLVQHGAEMNEWRGAGVTALFLAIENANWQLSYKLVELGASVDPKGNTNSLVPKALLHILTSPGGTSQRSTNFYGTRGQLMRLILKKHPELDREFNDLRVGEDIVNNPLRVRIAVQSRFNMKTETLLTAAIRRVGVDYDAIDMIKLLLQLGFNPNCQERLTGHTPLLVTMRQYCAHFLAYHHDAALTTSEQKDEIARNMRRYVHVMEMLLDRGATVKHVPVPRGPSGVPYLTPLAYLIGKLNHRGPLNVEVGRNLMQIIWQYNESKERRILSTGDWWELSRLRKWVSGARS